jgi:hypothetical protein
MASFMAGAWKQGDGKDGGWDNGWFHDGPIRDRLDMDMAVKRSGDRTVDLGVWPDSPFALCRTFGHRFCCLVMGISRFSCVPDNTQSLDRTLERLFCKASFADLERKVTRSVATFSAVFAHSFITPYRPSRIESGRISTGRHSLPTVAKQIQVRENTELNPTRRLSLPVCSRKQSI